jgi:hypothetical protein
MKGKDVIATMLCEYGEFIEFRGGKIKGAVKSSKRPVWKLDIDGLAAIKIVRQQLFSLFTASSFDMLRKPLFPVSR